MTVIVGANNAGKSTVVEGLRIVGLVTDRLRRGSMPFVGIPDWLDDRRAFRGIQPVLRRVDADANGAELFHRYQEPPAVLTATFRGGASVTAFVGEDGEIHGVARDPRGVAVGSPSEARALGLPILAIQPQVAPLLRDERILAAETVRRGEGTHLASQHFRNQIFRSGDQFEMLRAMAEDSWPGLQIVELAGSELHPDQPLRLHVRDTDFVGEVSLMGHGLQMWLQLMWFVARTPLNAGVVLDEPDVYMHPDLQRRLLETVRNRFGQLIIATHSVEILADVDPSCVLSVDRRISSSSYVSDLPGIQAIIDSLGGVHNIHLARLFRSTGFYLVEGEDVRLLRILQRVVDPSAPPIDLVPHGELGGRGGWAAGLLPKLPRKNARGQRIRTYCLLDRDYYPADEVAERYEEARKWSIELRVWSRKELENFLLIPSAISRHISNRSTVGGPPTPETVAAEIDRIVESMKDDPIRDGIGTEILSRNKRLGFSGARRVADGVVATAWATQAGRWAMAPGKAVLSRLSEWSQSRFGVSFGADQLARTLQADEVDPEIRDVLEAIPAGRSFKA